MKTSLVILVMLGSFAHAAEVVIPMNQINRYVGSFSDLEKNLKSKILDAAEKECGSLDKASIESTTIEISLSSVFKHNVRGEGDDSKIVGSYPQAGAKVNIDCH